MTNERKTLIRIRELIDEALSQKEEPDPITGPETIVAHHSEFGDLTFIRMTHTPGLRAVYLMKDAIPGFEFDATEALCVCPNGLKAGTYFEDPDSSMFTLTRDVPEGGVLVYERKEEGAITFLVSYPDITSRNCIERVPLKRYTNSKSATRLCDAVGEENVNNRWRARYGSGNYVQSGIRQWLESDAPAGQWWRPAHKFDRMPSYVGRPGFLNGFDPDFVEKLIPTTLSIELNGVYEVDLPKTDDPCSFSSKMFLPSYTELTGRKNNKIAEGEMWDACNGVYEEACNTYECDRLKKLSLDGKRVWWWQRSCDPSYPGYARAVDTIGHPRDNGWACDPCNAVAAACVIEF